MSVGVNRVGVDWRVVIETELGVVELEPDRDKLWSESGY